MQAVITKKALQLNYVLTNSPHLCKSINFKTLLSQNNGSAFYSYEQDFEEIVF